MILYFHSIGDLPLSVQTRDFRNVMLWLARKGFTGVTVHHLVENGFQKNEIGITFDDCFLSAYENALPVLLELGFHATFFAATDYIGQTRWGSVRHQRWADEKSEDFDISFRYMNRDQIREAASLRMEIGAHTVTHRNLTDIGDADLEKEVRESRRILQELLKAPVHTFCYPRGKFNARVIDAVKAAGYRAACANQSGPVDETADLYCLNRIPGGRLTFQFKSLFDPRYAAAVRCRERVKSFLRGVI